MSNAVVTTINLPLIDPGFVLHRKAHGPGPGKSRDGASIRQNSSPLARPAWDYKPASDQQNEKPQEEPRSLQTRDSALPADVGGVDRRFTDALRSQYL
jgi:hypothetical protein